uniref:Uncharacterized protein n=1 Tax=Arion vulgaris TaxID=1028688 RepID=A0A0B7A4Q7_9EUPU
MFFFIKSSAGVDGRAIRSRDVIISGSVRQPRSKVQTRIQQIYGPRQLGSVESDNRY